MEVTKTVESAVENKGNAMFTHLFSCSHAHTRAHIHAHKSQTIRKDKACLDFIHPWASGYQCSTSHISDSSALTFHGMNQSNGMKVEGWAQRRRRHRATKRSLQSKAEPCPRLFWQST